MFIHILFHVCLCVIVLSLRSDSDYNKEATYLLTYLLRSAYTILEVAADPMMPRRITRPSIARANEQLDGGAAHRHTTAPISHARPSPRSS